MADETGRRNKRRWDVLFPIDPMTGEIDESGGRELVRQALMDLEGTGHHLGGAFILQVIRAKRQVEMLSGHVEERHVTVGMAFEYTSFAPDVEFKAVAPAQPAEAAVEAEEPEREPVEA